MKEVWKSWIPTTNFEVELLLVICSSNLLLHTHVIAFVLKCVCVCVRACITFWSKIQDYTFYALKHILYEVGEMNSFQVFVTSYK